MANTKHTISSVPREAIGDVMPYAHLSTDDLLQEVFNAREVNPLMLELAHRLEAVMNLAPVDAGGAVSECGLTARGYPKARVLIQRED